MESASVHDTHQYEYVDRATEKHRRVYGDRVPQPSPAHSYEVVVDHPHFGHHHYVVLASGPGDIVAVYRVRKNMQLWQTLRWPKALTLAHKERVRQHARHFA
jgi:hypothetical protein